MFVAMPRCNESIQHFSKSAALFGPPKTIDVAKVTCFFELSSLKLRFNRSLLYLKERGSSTSRLGRGSGSLFPYPSIRSRPECGVVITLFDLEILRSNKSDSFSVSFVSVCVSSNVKFLSYVIGCVIWFIS